MSTPRTVLVTGSAGRVGRAAVRALVAAGHAVRGLDRAPTPGLPASESLVGGVGDAELLAKAVAGRDTVIHLAATPDDRRFPRGPAPDDGDNFLDELVPNNVVAPYLLFEACRKAGVGRVVLASTGQVVDGHLNARNTPVTAGVLPRPRYLYACTKVFLEALGQVYAKEHGLAVVAARIGWCPRDKGQVAEIAVSRLGQDVFFSPGDVGRFFAAAVGAEWKGYHVVYGASRPTHEMVYDLAPAERLFGYVPREAWPAGAEDFR